MTVQVFRKCLNAAESPAALTLGLWAITRLRSQGRRSRFILAHQKGLSSGVVSGSGEEVTLHEFALELFEQADLFCGFSAFGYDLKTQVVSQHNDDAHDLSCFAVGVNL